MIRPVSIPVGQGFGENPTRHQPHPQFGDYQPDGHTGQDYPVHIGTPIRAVTDGVVIHVGYYRGTYRDNPFWIAPGFAGWCYVIDHGSFIGIYAHGKEYGARVFSGEAVTEGQIIGLSGNTGGSTGPHLHFEVLPDQFVVNGPYYGRIDPETLFNTPVTPQSTTEEDEMANLTEENLDAIADRVARKIHTEPDGKTYSLLWFLKSDREKLAELSKGIISGVLRSPLTWLGFNGKKQTAGRTTTTLETAIGYQDAIAAELRTRLDETNARLDKLIEAATEK